MEALLRLRYGCISGVINVVFSSLRMTAIFDEFENEGTAAFWALFNPNAALHGEHEMLDDGQAETRAAVSASSPGIDSEESLEDSGAVGRRNSGSIIDDMDLHRVLEDCASNTNDSRRRTVLDCVVQKIGDDLFQRMTVC